MDNYLTDWLFSPREDGAKTDLQEPQPESAKCCLSAGGYLHMVTTIWLNLGKQHGYGYSNKKKKKKANINCRSVMIQLALF